MHTYVYGGGENLTAMLIGTGVCGNLVYFVVLLVYIFCGHFGMLYQEKSAKLAPRHELAKLAGGFFSSEGGKSLGGSLDV
jgi:hypothetical protein